MRGSQKNATFRTESPQFLAVGESDRGRESRAARRDHSLFVQVFRRGGTQSGGAPRVCRGRGSSTSGKCFPRRRDTCRRCGTTSQANFPRLLHAGTGSGVFSIYSLHGSRMQLLMSVNRTSMSWTIFRTRVPRRASTFKHYFSRRRPHSAIRNSERSVVALCALVRRRATPLTGSRSLLPTVLCVRKLW